MAGGKSYKVRGVVLRKTKLGEKDLIVTLLLQDGSLVRAVAKGARKPGGSLAARFELFSCVDALMARGRNLDVVSEARLSAGQPARFGLEQASCASAVAELVCLIAQEGLEHPRLFDMTSKAFASIAAAQPADALAIASASLLKTLASEGLRPSFDACIQCGREVGGTAGTVLLSIEGGGVVCETCPRPADAMLVEAATVAWSRALLFERFDDIPGLRVDPDISFSVLQFAHQYTRAHVGRTLKSLDFLFTCGLF